MYNRVGEGSVAELRWDFLQIDLNPKVRYIVIAWMYPIASGNLM